MSTMMQYNQHVSQPDSYSSACRKLLVRLLLLVTGLHVAYALVCEIVCINEVTHNIVILSQHDITHTAAANLSAHKAVPLLPLLT